MGAYNYACGKCGFRWLPYPPYGTESECLRCKTKEQQATIKGLTAELAEVKTELDKEIADTYRL